MHPNPAFRQEPQILNLNLARKRGFGPFGREELDLKRREKQIAAMVRAGHGFDAARAVTDAASEEELEEWLIEAQEDDW